MAQQQNPKTLINQFYQRAKAEPPRYEVELAPVDGQESRFMCTLTLPSVTVEGETLPEQIFQEEGRSKKAAQDAAAATALRFLSEQPVYGTLKPYEESLLRTLATRVLSPQGLYRDPEMHGAAAASVAYLEGYLPLASLPHSRILRGWAKEYGKSYDADLASEPMALIDVVYRELAAQAAAAVPQKAAEAEAAQGAAAEGLQGKPAQDPALMEAWGAAAGAASGAAAAMGLGLGPAGLSVRLPREAAEVAPPGVICEEMDPAVVAAGSVATLVVIPWDSSLPLREESVPAHGSLLIRVAELLGCPSPHHVLQWGRVGHKASFVADPGVATARGEALAAAAAAAAAAGAAGAAAAAAAAEKAEPAPSAAMVPSTAASVGGDGDGGREEGNPAVMLQPAESESEAASAPAAAPAAAFAAPAPPPPRSHRRTAAAAAASPTASEQSVCLPPSSSLGGEVTGGLMLLEPKISLVAATGLAAGGRGGGGGGIIAAMPLAQPPASPAVYRAESTLTLAVHRGPAAMDWEADGQNEVRGPEHAAAPSAGPATGGGRGGGGGGGSAAGGRVGQPLGVRQSGTHHRGAAHSHPRGEGGGAAAGLPSLEVKQRGKGSGGGGSSSAVVSPRHINIHPFLTTVPEPSLYSKLLLPPLPTPPPNARRGLEADAPPLLASLRNAAAATSRKSTTALGGSSSGGSSTARSALPYSLAGESLNVRATWLSGRPVYGDAVATTCRQSPTPQTCKNHHVMKWRNYGPADEWRTASAMTPAATYTRAAHAPLLLRGLPTEYRGPAAWVGPSPRQLLDGYVAAHAPAAAITSLELVIPDVDLPGEGLAELTGTNFLGLPYKVIAGPGPLELVAQQAALSALLKLQSLDAACLAGTVTPEQLAEELPPPTPAPAQQQQQQQQRQVEQQQQPDAMMHSATAATAATAAPATATATTTAAQQRASTAVAATVMPSGQAATTAASAEVAAPRDVDVDVEVLDPGLTHARQPQEGCMVKIAYTISLPPEPGTQLETNTGAADGEAEAGVAGSRGGVAPGPSHLGGSSLVLEQHPGLSLVVGPGGAAAVPAVVDAAVRRLRVGGSARCRLPVALEGCDPLAAGFQLLPAQLDVRLLHATLPLVEGKGAGGAGAGPPLFTPPLGQQRMEAVAAVLRREGVATLVDLGCGECKLVEGLVLARQGSDCGAPLTRVVGVDISRGALQGAAKRLTKLTAAAGEVERLPIDGEESAPRPVEVSLYRGSALSPALNRRGAAAKQARGSAAGGESTDPWVSLRGCDAVTMVEVVEHLDPEPLQLVGPCVLGGLRPRTLIVTTPNWEYNAVMRSQEQLSAAAAAAAAAASRRQTPSAKAGAPSGGGSIPTGTPATAIAVASAAASPGGTWPGPPGRDGLPLRCADHRFEWTRAEFRSWAEGMAATWGYEVSFQGIGRINNEFGALLSPGYLGPQNPGEATQMAVFRHKDGEEEGEGGNEAEEEREEEGEGWELVWGPAFVAAPREELEEVEAEMEAADAAAEVEGEGEGGQRVRVRVPSASAAIPAAATASAAGFGVKRIVREEDETVAVAAAAAAAANEKEAAAAAAGRGGGGDGGGGGGAPGARFIQGGGQAAKRQRRDVEGKPLVLKANKGCDPPDPATDPVGAVTAEGGARGGGGEGPKQLVVDADPDPPGVDVF